jgi:hypothetical protein
MLERLYAAFAPYRLPADLEVCEQCGPEWTVQDIRSTPLRSLSLLQLEAIHVMSLDDNDFSGFRHLFPRLIELLLADPAPVFAFDLSRLRGRVPTWPEQERTSVHDLVDDLWQHLLASFPAELGYFSDSPTLIDFTHRCDEALDPHLRRWQSLTTTAAAEHLANLLEYISYIGEPNEPAVQPTILEWLRQPIIGTRLREANCTAAQDLWVAWGGSG